MNITRMIFIRRKMLYMFLIYASFLCLSQAHASDSVMEPKQVVTALVEAMEANDADTIRSLFSREATQQYGRSSTRKKQGDAFRQWLESDIIRAHGRVNDPEIVVEGNEVVVTGTYSNNSGYTSAADFLLVVDNAKIISWTMRYD